MAPRTAWYCPRCKVEPPLANLIAPEPPMHDACSTTCFRRSYDDADPPGQGQAPPGVNGRQALEDACRAPLPSPKPRLG